MMNSRINSDKCMTMQLRKEGQHNEATEDI